MDGPQNCSGVPWPLGVCKAPGPERGTPAAGLARAPDHTHNVIHPHQGASPWCVQATRPVPPTITPAIALAGRAADGQQPEHRPRARHPPGPCDGGLARLLQPPGLLRLPGIASQPARPPGQQLVPAERWGVAGRLCPWLQAQAARCLFAGLCLLFAGSRAGLHGVVNLTP